MHQKQITKFNNLLVDLPTTELCLLLADTKDRQNVFNTLRDFYQDVAACTKANLEGRDDPLAHNQKGDKSDKLYHELVWNSVYMYLAWWNLIQQGFNDIKSVFEDNKQTFPFPKSFDLFLETIKCDANNKFLIYCQYFYEFNVTDQIKLNELKRKEHWLSLTIAERPELLRLEKQYPKNYWVNRCLGICERKAKLNPVLSTLLKAFQSSSANYYDTKRRILINSRKGRLSFSIRSKALVEGEWQSTLTHT